MKGHEHVANSFQYMQTYRLLARAGGLGTVRSRPSVGRDMIGRPGERGACLSGTSVSEALELVLVLVNHRGGPRSKALNTEGDPERGEGGLTGCVGCVAKSSEEGDVNCRLFISKREEYNSLAANCSKRGE